MAIHLVLFAVWIEVNLLPLSLGDRFYPRPFPLLDTGIALEAILLAGLILIRQAALTRRTG